MTPDANGWFDVGDDMANIPNDCFDIIAKYYDASLDTMMMARFPGCVRVGDRIFWGSPFPGHEGEPVDLMKHGYRPTHWMLIPKPPVQP